MNLISRRSALAGAAALTLLAACANPDGTKPTTRQVLAKVVAGAKILVRAGQTVATLYRTNCANKPDSKLCTDPTILLAVAAGEGGLRILSAALAAAEAALDDQAAPEERVGVALGNLLSAQDDVEAMIDLFNKQHSALPLELQKAVQDARRALDGMAVIRQQAYVPIY